MSNFGEIAYNYRFPSGGFSSGGGGIPFFAQDAEKRNSRLRKKKCVFSSLRIQQNSLRTRYSTSTTGLLAYPHPEGDIVVSSLMGCPKLEQFKCPKLEDSLFEKHIFRLKETLLGWQKNIAKNKEIFEEPKWVLIKNILLGNQYADWIWDQMAFQLRNQLEGAQCVYINSDPELYIDKKFWGFDYYFFPHHLLPFDSTEDERKQKLLKDFNHMRRKPSKLSKEFIEEFKAVVRENIHQSKDYKIFLDDVDYMSTLTTSVGYEEGQPKASNRALRLAKQSLFLDTSNEFCFESCFVYKQPHEKRSCVIPSLKTKNSLTLLKKYHKMVLQHPDDYYYKKEPWSVVSRWLKASEEDFFIMSDLKKSGMTFNRDLFFLILDVLKEEKIRYPFDIAQGWKNPCYIIDGELNFMPTGFGLGMEDDIISFTLACLGTIYKQRHSDRNIEAKFWGDDQVIKIKAPFEIPYKTKMDLAEDWDLLLEEAGLVVHEWKPFIASAGVFMETYGQQKYANMKIEKQGQFAGTFYWPLLCHNIVQAKQFMSAIWDTVWEDWAHIRNPALRKCIEFWGYEFSEEEIYVPYEIGGWIPFNEKGINQLVSWITKEVSKEQTNFYRFFNLLQFSFPTCPPKGEDNEDLLKYIKTLSPSEEFLRMSEMLMYPKMSRLNLGREAGYFDKCLKKRKNIFSKGLLETSQIYNLCKNLLHQKTMEIPIEFLMKGLPDEMISINVDCGRGMDPKRARILLEGHPTDRISYPSRSWGEIQSDALAGVLESINIEDINHFWIGYCIKHNLTMFDLKKKLPLGTLSMKIDESIPDLTLEWIIGKGKYLCQHSCGVIGFSEKNPLLLNQAQIDKIISQSLDDYVYENITHESPSGFALECLLESPPSPFPPEEEKEEDVEESGQVINWTSYFREAFLRFAQPDAMRISNEGGTPYNVFTSPVQDFDVEDDDLLGLFDPG